MENSNKLPSLKPHCMKDQGIKLPGEMGKAFSKQEMPSGTQHLFNSPMYVRTQQGSCAAENILFQRHFSFFNREVSLKTASFKICLGMACASFSLIFT